MYILIMYVFFFANLYMPTVTQVDTPTHLPAAADEVAETPKADEPAPPEANPPVGHPKCW